MKKSSKILFINDEEIIILDRELLLKKIKSENTNICMETALHTLIEFVKIALKYINIFIININYKTIKWNNKELWNKCRNYKNIKLV